eukprot:9243921-Alexandrium_andersonii.AAC.1
MNACANACMNARVPNTRVPHTEAFERRNVGLEAQRHTDTCVPADTSTDTDRNTETDADAGTCTHMQMRGGVHARMHGGVQP